MTTLIDRLCHSVEHAPAAEAVVHGAVRVSYETLWSDVCAFASFLSGEGLAAGARVALLLGNSPTYVAAYYGALRAGAAVVALNAQAKAPDIATWLAHCGAAWLVADSAHPELPKLLANGLPGVRVVLAGSEAPDGARFRWQDICGGLRGRDGAARAARADQLAAILYTSGTTGRPKGVMLSHGNLSANVESILGYLPLRAGSRIVNVLPFYYSYGNSVLHTHVAAGGCLVIEDNLVYPHRVVERLAAERADGFAGVPSTFSLLLNRVRLADYDLSALRYVTQAGGAMAHAKIKQVLEQLPHVQFFVMYGQTEATARLAYLPPAELLARPGSCGVPIPGVEIEVRGEDGAVAAPGGTGEVWVRGPNVMQGYWNDPEATRAALRDGWLRTGDMGYRDADGFLYLHGRRNDMIKTGAHRVHPTEIEEVIAELDDVAEVAVVGVEDDTLGHVVKALVRARPGRTLEPLRIKAHCRDRLALYKVPKHVELVDELPRTNSGKIKRYLLAGSATQ